MEAKYTMKEFLNNWDIGEIDAIEPIHSYSGKASLVKTIDDKFYILKEKSDLAQTEHESNLLFSLYEAAAPVAVPIRTIHAKWYAETQGKIFCLYPMLSGEVIAEHYAGNATERAEMFGKAISFLHDCFLKCRNVPVYPDIQLLEQVRNWAIPRIQEHTMMSEGNLVESIWEKVEQDLNAVYAELPIQLIHRDLHPANMLFNDGNVTGFIDFEITVRGPRVFDVCYCGTSLLVGAFPDTQKMQTWISLFAAILKGYQRVSPLIPSEIRALPGILAAIELMFAAFSFETQAIEAAKCNLSVLKWLSANREAISESIFEGCGSLRQNAA